MIRLTDTAIILSSRKHAETSALIDVLSESHGTYKGVTRGAFSAKNRGIYQPGNIISMTWEARLPEHMGSIKGELLTPYAALIMPDAKALPLLSSATALLALALPERHPYPKIYEALRHLLAHLTHAPNECLAEYIHFELLLLAETGFGLDLSECAGTGSTDNLIYVSPKSGRAVSRDAGEPYKDKLLKLPAFLLHPEAPIPSAEDAARGLALTGYFLEHWLFEALHRKLPAARKRLMP